MVALLCLVVALQAQLPSPRVPARDAVAEKKGSAVIRGKVISLDGERPLRRARISISAPELSEPRTTSTDALGAYEVRELPAGRYTISVNRSGYLPLQYGQLRPGEPARPLQLADAQVLERIDFALPRAAVISGRVTDETGEPFAGVAVWAVQQQYFRGRRRLVPVTSGMMGSNRTDDTGEYRILGLAPGEYLVMGTTRDTWSADEEQTQIFGYAATYAPGVVNGTEGQRIKIAVGQELAGVDLSMVPMRTASVSGTAFASDGSPMAAASVLLTQEIAGPSFGSASMGGTTKTTANGSWIVRNVTPGDYQIRATSTERDRPAEGAQVTITVQGADVDGVILAADAGATVTGRVATDAGGPLPAPRLRVSTQVTGATATVMGGVTVPGVPENNGIVGADGNFQFKGASGPLAFRVGALPRDWAIKRVDINGRDHAEVPLDVRSGQRVDGATIVLTNRFPALEGRLVDDRGKPANGTVVLCSADPAKWLDTLGITRSARPDQSGAFRFEPVRPGEYLLFALEYIQQWQINDPEFLEEHRRRATKVTLGETTGEPVTLTILR